MFQLSNYISLSSYQGLPEIISLFMHCYRLHNNWSTCLLVINNPAFWFFAHDFLRATELLFSLLYQRHMRAFPTFWLFHLLCYNFFPFSSQLFLDCNEVPCAWCKLITNAVTPVNQVSGCKVKKYKEENSHTTIYILDFTSVLQGLRIWFDISKWCTIHFYRAHFLI